MKKRSPVRAGGGKEKPSGQRGAGPAHQRERVANTTGAKQQSKKLDENSPKESRRLRLSQDWEMEAPERPGRSCNEERA